MPSAAPNRLLHILLLGGAHGVEAKVGQSTEQAISGWCVESIGTGPKFGEEIEDALRHGPAEYLVAAKFGAGVERDEQSVRAGCIWRRRSELILPNSELAPAVELMCNQANRFGPVAGCDGELKVRQYDFAEGVKHYASPRSRRTTG